MKTESSARLRIMIVVPSLSGGGAERVSANLANAWADRGHSVVIVTYGANSNDGYTVSNKVVVVEHDLTNRGRNLIHRMIMIVRRIVTIRKDVVSFDPDFVVGVMAHVAFIVSIAAFGRRTIGCEHTFPPRSVSGTLERLCRWAGYGLLGRVTALTEEAASWLRVNTLARSVVTIANPLRWPVPDQPPRVSPDSVCVDGRKILLAAGRLEHVKGFDILLAAFARVSAEHSNWDLVVVGEGPERAELGARIDALGLGARAFLPGRVGNMGEWYQRADLFVLSSRNEGLPSALIEAMAYGVPAVSFDCQQGPRDIIRDGIDGLLVPNGEIPALASTLAELMADSDRRDVMGKAATHVRERFSEHAILQQWDELFAQMKP